MLLAGAASASPLDRTTEVRGDFHYDAGGELLGVRHADFPAGFVRRPMSHRDKFDAQGIRLPERPATLAPRAVRPKPARVDVHDGLMTHRVMVKFAQGTPVRLRDGELAAPGAVLDPVRAVLESHPTAVVERAFSLDERILDEDRDTGERISGRELADLNNWYVVRFPDGSEEGIQLANELLALGIVETVYLDARAEAPVCADIAPVTPDLSGGQFYLEPAPAGVDAVFAWAHDPGGDGAGSDFWVVDCEWAWCFDHEDLDITVADVVNGSTDNTSNGHGTAVLGEFGACDNDYGVTGISSDVSLKMSDFDSEPSWGANIATAASFLTAGEIVLLEIHLPGPDSGLTCQCNCGQFEFVPVEWDQASYDAIETATANGIVVVEAGGNGSMNLNSPIYQGAFDLLFRDSGAILVGAGQPGSHSPECWTNSGWRIDAHGYGSSVRTTGYGDLWNQAGCEQDYTGTFSGTSSASPILVGVCASVQGVANERYGFDLAPRTMRSLIKVGATPQGPPLSRTIRGLPDLQAVLQELEQSVDAPSLRPDPTAFRLGTPRPNPFGTATAIAFDVPAGGGEVSLAVFDVRGRRVADLVAGFRPAGRHTALWNGRDAAGEAVASGVYFVRMETAAGSETRKLTRLD
jgi:hypothetical protein